jgi:hypothetical protein
LTPRICHTAARVYTVGLFLLLWTYPNAIPDWVVHDEVFIGDVFYDAIAIITWVRFEIDTLKRLVHYYIFENHVFDTSVVRTWRDGSDGHAY